MEHTDTFSATFAELVAKGVIPNLENLSTAAEKDRKNNIKNLFLDIEQKGEVSQIRAEGLRRLESIHEIEAAKLPELGNPFAIYLEDPKDEAFIREIDNVYTIRQAWEQFVLRAATGLALADPDKLDQFLNTDPNEISASETMFGKAFLYELGCAIKNVVPKLITPRQNLDNYWGYFTQCVISQKLAEITDPDEPVNTYPTRDPSMRLSFMAAKEGTYRYWSTSERILLSDLFERCGFTIHPRSTDA